ncbi:MAG TPA: histidine kinase dimerization/phospho-acceptor domain-containing protein [Gaiellaceae bacterium]|nr:histidine kinase dimerization/phospho-acceptor domain-containing protein [Gaiellaceae bacterium]
MTLPHSGPGDAAFHETLGRLTRGALHEFSNPLLGLLGNTELALMDLEPDSPLRERLEIVLAAANELAEIVRALQAFTRERTSPPRRLALADTTEQAVRLVRLVAANPNVDVELRREDGPHVVAPAGRVLQAITAAIADALAEEGRDPVLEVVVRTEGDDAVVAVDGLETLRLPVDRTPVEVTP